MTSQPHATDVASVSSPAASAPPPLPGDPLAAAIQKLVAEKVGAARAEVADLKAIADAAIHYVNCDDREAQTGEPYDLLVQAVWAYVRNARERRPRPVLDGP